MARARRRPRAVLAALSGAPFVLLAAGLWAGAVAQQVPSAETPGQIEKRFDDRTRLRGPTYPEIEISPAVGTEPVIHTRSSPGTVKPGRNPKQNSSGPKRSNPFPPNRDRF